MITGALDVIFVKVDTWIHRGSLWPNEMYVSETMFIKRSTFHDAAGASGHV
jgi:hypothetical protein